MTTLEKIAVVQEDLSNNASNLVAAHTRAFAAADALAAAKFVLASARNWILTHNDPKDLGSNEAQREASLAERCETEVNSVFLAENKHREAQHDLTLAQLDYDATKLQIRLLEAASRFAGSGE